MKKDRKRMRRRAGSLVAAVVFGLLAVGGGKSLAVPVQASGRGRLTVQLEEFAPPSDREGVRIVLCQVGTADVYGEPEFYGQYKIGSYPVNSKETEAVIEKLLAAGALAEAPLYEVTDAGGAARFAGLSDGIYLGAAQESSSYGEISPFLIHTPYYYGTENGGAAGVSYDVTVHPKALPIEYITPTPEPTATSTPEPTETPEIIVTPTPGETDRPGGGNAGGGGAGSDTDTGNPPKTGDDTPTGLLLGLLCVSGITIGMVRNRRRENV